MSSPESVRPSARRPLLRAVAITLAWHVVLFAAVFGLPTTARSWFRWASGQPPAR